jgi:DNA-binding MarR family transcriptional regulator
MQILMALHKGSQYGEAAFSKALPDDADVTVRQGALLAAIKANPGASQTVLMRASGIDRSTLADMVKRMTKKGWVKRRRNKDDARAYIVDITPDGEKALKQAISAAKTAETALLVEMPKVKALAA